MDSRAPTADPPHATRSALPLVRLAGLWILAGALAKTFAGNPGDLPAPILASDLDPILVIVVAVAVECVVAALAIVAPRVGWLPALGLLAVFVTLLVGHLRAGAESCGCFGGSMPIPAWLVLSIDAALLVGIAVTAFRARLLRFERAWTRLAAIAACVGVVAGGVSAFVADSRLAVMKPTAATSNATPLGGTPAPSRVPTTGPSNGPATPSWSLPAVIPPQVILRPITWINKKLADTELGRWTDTSKFPADATIIIYYLSCNHCAGHLKELAAAQAENPAAAPTYVLVQLPTPKAYTGKLFVDTLPTSALQVTLPSEVGAYVITPPWDVVVKGGTVVSAKQITWGGPK